MEYALANEVELDRGIPVDREPRIRLLWDVVHHMLLRRVKNNVVAKFQIGKPEAVSVTGFRATIRLPEPPAGSGIKLFKVQFCRVKHPWSISRRRSSDIPVCGFGAVSSVWPSPGTDKVDLVGLVSSARTGSRFVRFVASVHVDSEILEINTTVQPSRKAVILSPSKWLRFCAFVPLPPSAPVLVSRHESAAILRWGQDCFVTSSLLRWAHECSSRYDGTGKSSLMHRLPPFSYLADFVRKQMTCKKQTFVLYFRLYGEESFTDAECSQYDRGHSENDDPLECFVQNLQPGRLYEFVLANENERGISSRSKNYTCSTSLQ